MAVSVYKPVIKRKDMDAVLSTLVNESIGPGSEMRRFCLEMSKYIGIEKGTALRERPRALSIALKGLELSKGDAVVISALSPAYYVDVLDSLGFLPVYADVDPDSGTITPNSVEAVMKYSPKAMIVHYPFGFIPEIDKLTEFELPVIEDISQAVSARLEDRSVGSFGAFTLVDLEWNSLITAGGGCMVFPATKKYRREIKPVIDAIHDDYLLPDMNASLGQIQLNLLDKYVADRIEIEDVFRKSLMKSRHKTFLQRGEWKNVPFSFPVVVQSSMNDVIQYTHKKGILAEPAFGHCALSQHPVEEYPCPSAQRVMLRTVLFPLYPMLGKKNIGVISKILATLP